MTSKKYLADIFFNLYFVFQSAFMNEQQQTLDTLKDIRSMMDRSSRFISLSGLSGVAAGICALVGAWFANNAISDSPLRGMTRSASYRRGIAIDETGFTDTLGGQLVLIALVTFTAALASAFFFTWLRSRKTGIPLFGAVSKRVTVAVAVPLMVGGFYLLQLLKAGAVGYIAPGCLLFYGLALINTSKYTYGEIGYLGYCELVLGLISLGFQGYGIFFWALGFGVLHIVYGIYMWFKYEK
jgi:hypothetical protein